MDIENRKWIKASLSIEFVASSLIRNKKWMKEYADELGWILEVDKEGSVGEDGNRFYEVRVVPDSSQKISPEELRKVIDKLKGFAQEIYSVLYPEEREFEFQNRIINFQTAKTPEEPTLIFDYSRVLLLEYKFIDRVELFRKSPNLDKFIFERTLQDEVKKMKLDKTSHWHRFVDGKEIFEAKKIYKQRLKEWYGLE